VLIVIVVSVAGLIGHAAAFRQLLVLFRKETVQAALEGAAADAPNPRLLPAEPPKVVI
jgi:hypothetical protein